VSLDPLTGSLREVSRPARQDLSTRGRFLHVAKSPRRYGYCAYSKSTDEAPQAVCAAKDDAGRGFRGVNFRHLRTILVLLHIQPSRKRRRDAITDYGVHSAGSAAFLGNTKYSLALQTCISEFLQLEHTVLLSNRLGRRVTAGHQRPDPAR